MVVKVSSSRFRDTKVLPENHGPAGIGNHIG